MVMTLDKNRESQLLLRMRAMAVWLIVLAHSSALPENASSVAVRMEDFLSSVSRFGVWIFFALGGYLLAYEQKPLLAVLRKKVQTILIPWLFTGTIVYLYVFIRRQDLSLLSYVQYLLGYGTYLWYMAVYSALLIVFLLLRKVKWFSVAAVIVGIVLECTRLLYPLAGEDYKFLYFLVQWEIPFGIGYIINAFHFQQTLYTFICKFKYICIFVSLVLVIFDFCWFGVLWYWSTWYMVLALFAAPAVIGVVLVLEKSCGKVMEHIGKASYSIYLLHMPVVGLVSHLCCRFDRGFSVPFRPFIAIGVTYLALYLLQKLAKRCRCETIFKLLIGLR